LITTSKVLQLNKNRAINKKANKCFILPSHILSILLMDF
jgi:hypothetical protein